MCVYTHTYNNTYSVTDDATATITTTRRLLLPLHERGKKKNFVR